MEHPPTPPNSGHEPDLPKPPIWERGAASSKQPPIVIPQAGIPQPQSIPPIVPEITQSLPVVEPPQADRRPGPSFADRSFMSLPASGAGISDKPQWPSEPPMVGHTSSPTPPMAPKPRRRVGLIALAIMLAAAVGAGAFLFGRSVATSETATTPIVAAPTESPTTIPESTPQATTVPDPTPVPSLPPVNDAPSPVLPGEGADEPVAAVARAVAPTVVLIQHQQGQGSGIIYDESGLILTNAHVVGQFTDVQVTLASGVRVLGEVVGADPLTDVAVVKIDTEFEFGVAVLAPEASVEVGQLAVAIGSPFGLDQTVTSGIVSATGRVRPDKIDDTRYSIVAMIQTDAPINPGNSGGALADRQGRVIGMNTSITTIGTEEEPGGNLGVGFAVPAETAKLIADRILAGEPLEQGFLGVGPGPTLPLGEPGAIIGVVTEGSGAEIAGLQIDDRIVRFNDTEIKSMNDLAAAVRLQPPNATVVIELVRDGELLAVNVTLGLFEQ